MNNDVTEQMDDYYTDQLIDNNNNSNLYHLLKDTV